MDAEAPSPALARIKARVENMLARARQAWPDETDLSEMLPYGPLVEALVEALGGLEDTKRDLQAVMLDLERAEAERQRLLDDRRDTLDVSHVEALEDAVSLLSSAGCDVETALDDLAEVEMGLRLYGPGARQMGLDEARIERRQISIHLASAVSAIESADGNVNEIF